MTRYMIAWTCLLLWTITSDLIVCLRTDHKDKRLREFGQKIRDSILHADGFKNIVHSFTSTKRSPYFTDVGYGSRVQAATKLAKALIARDSLFGALGPGRRKRTYKRMDTRNSHHGQEEKTLNV